jgi:alcohol dehydrogenase, propanol-preferring
MRAVTLHQPASIDDSPLRVESVATPTPSEDEVLVKVVTCGVCRTDLHIIEGDLPIKKSPLVLGHQVVGRVEQLGKDCHRLHVGDRVGIPWLGRTDGTCRFCREGRENLCPASQYIGYDRDGGFAQFTVVPEAFAYELPPRIDDVAVAPLLCAGLIGYRSLKRADVPTDGKLLLVGFGSSAHVVLQIARHRGHQVYVASRSHGHRALAESLGAVWTGETLNDLPVKMDSAILFAPIGDLVPPVMEQLDRGGTLAIGGIHLTDIPKLEYERHLFYDKQIRSVTANTREDGRRLLAEAVEAGVEPHTSTYALEDANRALQDLKHSRIDGTGVLVLAD